MGTLQLVLKQMRQRALGTWLTLLSVLLGVALAISILLLRDAGQALFGQSDYGSDVIVGVGRGSATQLVMNTVYHIDRSPGNIPWWVYEQIDTQSRAPRGSKEFDIHRRVKLAVPIAVGDLYKSRPIVGTLPKMFVSLEPLEQTIQGVLNRQAELTNQTRDRSSTTAELSRRESAIAVDTGKIQGEVVQSDRDGNPLVLPRNPDEAASKWKYGAPASVACQTAIEQFQAAAAAIDANRLADAAKAQSRGFDLLESVRQAVAAASGPLEYRPDRSFELAQGRVFNAWKFEAVIGDEVARKTGLKIGDVFQATHGGTPPGAAPDVHPEKWHVVGILKPTRTAADRCLYIPLLSFFSIAEHGKGLEEQSQARAGQTPTANNEDDTPKYHLVDGDRLLPDLPRTGDYIDLDVPASQWELSAILIKSRGGVAAGELIYYIANGGIPDVQAVNPAQVMQVFFDTFLAGSTEVLLLISFLVSIVAGVGILVSIYNSVSARTREIAILRALGATRGRILTVICTEAVLIGLIGGLAGMVVGHVLGGVASVYLNQLMGQGFNWVAVRSDEWIYLAVVVLIALLAGLVPALKAYRTPVATNLAAV